MHPCVHHMETLPLNESSAEPPVDMLLNRLALVKWNKQLGQTEHIAAIVNGLARETGI